MMTEAPMYPPAVDIIIPVWNSPVETRNCLVNLVAYSPGARLILFNNGSDRDTESLLEEFADSLDDRALLIGSQANLGFVRVVNQCLARVQAPYAAVVKPSSLVTPGWLEPLLGAAGTSPALGVVTPGFIAGNCRTGSVGGLTGRVTETTAGDFAAMLIRRELYTEIGGFDEEMDGASWCLRDFSRRALRAGFLTCSIAGSVVCRGEEPSFGSPARRGELLARSMAAFRERWGDTRSYCVYLSDSTDPDAPFRCIDRILDGARLGHTFTLVAVQKIHAALAGAGWQHRHQNIRLEKLPRLFPAGYAKRLIAPLLEADPGLVMVTDGEGTPIPGAAGSITLAELERQLAADAARYDGPVKSGAWSP